MSSVIDYTPAPTIKAFLKHYAKGELFADWIIGPVGSGKTTGLFFKLVLMASLQAKSPIDGKRRSRAVVVRNTMPQLKDTTITSWNYWFKDGEAGTWNATDKNFMLRFADVECEVLFRALDTADDVARVLSLETTFVLMDEFVQIKREIVDALAARCGRYPPMKDGGATNWGMWGSSNPGNEDSWWYDELKDAEQFNEKDEDRVIRRNERILAGNDGVSNWTFFKQPSGFSKYAENLDKLPGGEDYYTSLAKDKAPSWVKQFIEAEWGYSLAGKPVIATFGPEIHIAKARLRYNPHMKLVAGLDPGLAGMAMIFGQLDFYGRLIVLSEIGAVGYGAERFITDKLNPHLKTFYLGADFLISPDPAANQRSQTNEKTVVDTFKKHFNVKVATENNRLPGRIGAIEHYTTRITEMGAALQLDPTVVRLARALRSGWQYSIVTTGDEKVEPIKNAHSHYGDAFSYLCQHFYIGSARDEKRKKQPPLPKFTNNYAAR